MANGADDGGVKGLWRLFAAVGAGLAAGAAITQGLHLRRRPRRPDLSPEAFEAREPGRGRDAASPRTIPRRGWLDILWRLGAAYFGDRVGFVAGGVTFFTLLALAPSLASFVTLYGLLAPHQVAWDHFYLLYDIMPDGVANFIGDELKRLTVERTGELTLALLGTLLLSLWSANAAVKALFYGLNLAYHETEKRNVVHYNLVCMAFTLGALAFVLVTTLLVVVGPVLAATVGLGEAIVALSPLRWPLLLAIYVAALTLIYRWGPCRARAKWRWLTPGGLVAALLSVAVSALFSWYLAEFANFRRAYGPLGAFMGFLLWTWLSTQMILIGAKLNAEMEHQTAVDTTTGEPRPMGRRGALVADTLGARRGSTAALAYTQKHAEELARRLKLRRRGDSSPDPPE